MVSLKSIIGIIVGIAIVGIAIGGAIEFNAEREREGVPWREGSGPFQIEKYEYYLGEKIFINAVDIPADAAGEVIFFRPTSTPDVEKFEGLEEISEDKITTKTKYLAIKFNGENKQNFNRYFEPSLNEWKGICSRNDLAGEWVIVFQGTQYENISFKILNQTASWDERTFETIINKGKC